MASEKRGDLGNVLVIGGNGFLGHHIVNQALSSWNSTSVSSVDLRCTRNVNEKASYHECDITDVAKLTEVLQKIKPDVVIHTASPIASGEGKTAHDLFRKVNVEGTKAVIEACRQTGVKALVYTSSASVISDNENDLINADESYPVIRGAQQKEYYSETKVRNPSSLPSCSYARHVPSLSNHSN
jgi:sterol-4alpha-carboxylate 3-dehydrogenase (decarboxylating)